MRQENDVPRIFLSYAREDAAWQGNFVHDHWFKSHLGNAVLQDYLETANFGPISGWIDDQICEADAVLAFISRHYVASENTQREWRLALDLHARMGLVVVPVMMDDQAKAWWEQQATQLREHFTEAVGTSYAYADFRHRKGVGPVPILTEDGPIDTVTRRIGDIARLIAERLRERDKRPLATERSRLGSVRSADPRRPPELAVSEGAALLAAARDVSPPVVLLGHPTSMMQDEVVVEVSALDAALADQGIRPHHWADQWADSAAARYQQEAEMARQAALFLQPAAPREALLWGRTPDTIGEMLRETVQDDIEAAQHLQHSRIVLWLPKSLPNAAFASLTAARSGDHNPLLCHATPSELADQVRQISGVSYGPVPIVTIETLEQNHLREALRLGCEEALAGVVEPPPQSWDFFGSELLQKQLSVIDGARAIVAVHDLNTGRARSFREAYEAVESKVKGHQDLADQVLRRLGRQLNLFWTVMLVQKVDLLPIVTFPGRRRPNVMPLTFRKHSDPLRPVIPDPQLTPMFRSYLREWLAPDGRQ
jgi:hypothetical protein